MQLFTRNLSSHTFVDTSVYGQGMTKRIPHPARTQDDMQSRTPNTCKAQVDIHLQSVGLHLVTFKAHIEHHARSNTEHIRIMLTCGNIR